MEPNVLRNIERKKNLLMFIVNVSVPIAALLFVMLFLKGTVRDVSALLVSLAGVMIRSFEEKLGKIAKYFYVSIIPLFGTVVIIVGADGKFAAMTQAISETITKSIGEISEQAEQQRTEVNGSVDICDKLNGKILSSETYLHKTVDNINHLKEKNDEGMTAISELSLKFGENIKSTQAVSEEIKALSEKSSQTTNGITISVGEQMAGIEDIVRTLENVQKNVENGAEGLKSVLENESK